MVAAREFMPEGAITAARIESLFAEVFAAWSRDWFRDARVSLQLAAGHRNFPAMPGDFGSRQASVISVPNIEMSAIGGRRLLEAALAVNLEGLQSTKADRRVMDLFLDQITRDLIERLNFDVSAAASPAVLLDLKLNGISVAALSLPGDTLITRMRKAMRLSGKRVAFPCGRLEAAGPALVSIEGVLGTAQLTIRDLTDLAPGDVIVLDRRLDEPAGLRIVGGHHPIKWGHLTPDRAHNAVTVALDKKGNV